MKTLSLVLALTALVATVAFAQEQTVDVLYLKNGSIIRGQVIELAADVKIKTADGSIFVYPMSQVSRMIKEPVAPKPAQQPAVASPVVTAKPVSPPEPLVPPPVPKKEGVAFGLRGGLMGSFQIWDQTADGENKFGFGFMGTLTGGADFDDGDMYVGVGPHLGASFWSETQEVMGYDASATWNVLDYGLNLVGGFDEFYLLVGFGEADVSLTATLEGDSETMEMPDAAPYQRVGLGWGDGFSFGLSYVSYSDWAQNLSRFELGMGWAF